MCWSHRHEIDLKNVFDVLLHLSIRLKQINHAKIDTEDMFTNASQSEAIANIEILVDTLTRFWNKTWFRLQEQFCWKLENIFY